MIRKLPSTHSKAKTSRKMVCFAVILVVIGVASFTGYNYFKKSPRDLMVGQHQTKYALYASRVSGWITERKNHLNKKIVKIKRDVLRDKENEEIPVHFEFYTALPNMNIEHTQKIEVANRRNESNDPKSKIISKPLEVSRAESPFTDPKELEQQLLSKIK